MATKKKKAKKKSAPKRKTAPKKKSAPKKEPRAPALKVRELGPLRFAALVTRDKPVNFGIWHKMIPLAQQRGLAKKGAQFGAPFRSRDLKGPKSIVWYGAGVVVDDKQPIKEPLEEVRVERGEYMTYVYNGPYDGLADAWKSFVLGVRASGIEPDLERPCIELYKEMDPNKPRTELCVPVST